MRIPNKKKTSEKGIALFMVISSLAILSILIAELTYTVQVNSRMAYNGLDNLRAFYTAKAGMKLSLLRLKAYMSVEKFANENKTPGMKEALGKDILDKIWSFPFIYPIPTPPSASIIEKDAITKFQSESGLTGSFTASINSEGSRLNINNLLIKEVSAQSTVPGATPNPNPTPTPGATAGTSPVDFRPIVENAIYTALEAKKTEDNEFADAYKNVQAGDIVDAIEAYFDKNKTNSNLPGFKPFEAKNAPMYSITELHFIPGLDDELYKLIEPLLTVYSTPGINVNTASKLMFKSILVGSTDEDVEYVIKKRDDPDVGKLFSSEEDFWKTVGETSAAKTIENVKDSLKKANIKLITSEQSFKITVTASQGLSTRQLVSYVIINPNPKPKIASQKPPASANPSSPVPLITPAAANPNNPVKDSASAMKDSGLNLIYWQML